MKWIVAAVVLPLSGVWGASYFVHLYPDFIFQWYALPAVTSFLALLVATASVCLFKSISTP